ncbi:MAG: [Fe-Fe] hydrogenase large subunit C-terminal domain-containing protein [Cyanobacteriota bacterium]
MNNDKKQSIVSTIQEKCKTCYTCVRECPVKAIGISSGQAEVIENRCIRCGNCVKVCTQKAKKVHSSIDKLEELLNSSNKVAAIVAPSFPAEFIDLNYTVLIGILKELRFDYVNEVGFGADLVAKAYKEILEDKTSESYIATTCPAIVSFVEKYYPELIDKLAPIVSPMIATARVLRNIHGENLKIVFIGPCIAKKSEKVRSDLEGEINVVITFGELREYIESKNINYNKVNESEFDPPFAGKGGLFSISGGCLQAAETKEDLIEENVITASGKSNFVEAINEYSRGYLSTKILETLSCEGCILGPGISNKSPLYERRHLVSKYVRNKLKNFDITQWQKDIEKYYKLDLSCAFFADDQQKAVPSEELIKQTLLKLGKFEKNDELNCGACGYETCKAHAIAIITGFAESEMCLPYTIEKLKETVDDLEKSYDELKSIRETLDHREKLASMGQLSAGIAHELNNPLGVILMYSHIILEDNRYDKATKEDLEVIAHHANRCKNIVSGLLNFSRQNKIIKTTINLADLCQYCIDSIHIPSNITVKIIQNDNNVLADIDKDQISQVIINLINNSIDAMENTGGKINVIIGKKDTSVYFIIEDNGPGIPAKYRKQIFDPFFTTKQIGKGTGLGLSVSYGIVKMHSGTIDINTNTDPRLGKVGTSVHVKLPQIEEKYI